MTDLVLKPFEKLYPMMIRRYSDLIIDQNASEKDKINSIILKLNDIGKTSNNVVSDWNQVYKWLMGLSGSTSNRPTTNIYVGLQYFDTTLNKPIWCSSLSPVKWVDCTGIQV